MVWGEGVLAGEKKKKNKQTLTKFSEKLRTTSSFHPFFFQHATKKFRHHGN